MISCVAASLVFVATASATPATPTITVKQTTALAATLTSSTGTAWAWTVVDAAGATVTSAATNPLTVKVPAAGNYTAKLDATDADPVNTAPAHAELTFHVYDKPVANFTYSAQPDGTIKFVDASTKEPTTWAWTFPGSTTPVKAQAPPPQRLAPGNWTVSLKVTNAAGNNTISLPVVVNGPPQPVLTVTSSMAAIDAPVLLDASRSTDPNGDPLTYAWDLNGDGQYSDGTGPLQSVSYPKPGQYRVGVQVSDNHGASATAVAAITVVADQAPVISFSNSPEQPVVGANVDFTATASDPDGSVAKIEWDLDDDGLFDDAAGARASWTFATAGAHRVAVRAVDDRGVSTVAFRSLAVAAPGLTNQPGTDPSPQRSASGPAPIPTGPASSSSTHAPLLAPFPVVRIRGSVYRGDVRITLLRVQAPLGATIRVRCRGGSCAAKHSDVRLKAARAAVRVKSIERRALKPGTVIEVLVTAPNRIGKYTRFTIRRDASPSRSDLCLTPGRTKPTACPLA
ncbi:MAG TPA: PKD domain-containing protein [Baekduia sp.]